MEKLKELLKDVMNELYDAKKYLHKYMSCTDQKIKNIYLKLFEEEVEHSLILEGVAETYSKNLNDEHATMLFEFYIEDLRKWRSEMKYKKSMM